MGEVKVTEWLRGGRTAWMIDIQKANESAHGKSPPNLSKEWWRMFIRQCSAAGYISRIVKPMRYGRAIQGSYASLQPTEKGRSALSSNQSILLPQIDTTIMKIAGIDSKTHEERRMVFAKRSGKGKHMLPLLKELLQKKENWRNITAENKEQYQFPGWHTSPSSNVLYYTPDVTRLPHYSEHDKHFIWSDIQLSKKSTSKSVFNITLGERPEKLCYWMSQCKGVKKCKECDHVVPSCGKKNNCQLHPTSELVEVRDCQVEFVYIFPAEGDDTRRWVGGIIRSDNVMPAMNLHSHPVKHCLSHKVPSKVTTDIDKTMEDNPYLTTQQISTGQGIGYRPGSADVACSSYSRLNYVRNKSLKQNGLQSKGVHIIAEMEKIADKVDLKDCKEEGSTLTSQQYREIGRPYMRDYRISPCQTYQFIMTPLMSKLLSEADFVETDTTYNESNELIYLFNATVFDFNTMKWAVVARMRANKEDTEFYKTAFSLMFKTCHSDFPTFEVANSLKGIIVDWSDTETKGLRECVGEEVADRLLRGCNVHWARSYQRVAERVNNCVQKANRKLANEAFCAIAKLITSVKTKEDVLKCFDALQGSLPPTSLSHLKLPLSDEHLTVVETECDWSGARSWVEWWTRKRHLQMLAKPFSIMSSEDWDRAPRNTNGVERINFAAKSCGHKQSLYVAMQSLYEKDKVFALQYIASEGGSKISYRGVRAEEQRSKAAVKRKRCVSVTDRSASFGPPDKSQHLDGISHPSWKKSKVDGKNESEKKDVEVLYSDGVWYRGWLSSYNFETGKWIVQFYDDNETTEVSFPDAEVRIVH